LRCERFDVTIYKISAEPLTVQTLNQFLKCWAVGTLLTPIIGALAFLAPAAFGIFTVPFWILPVIAGYSTNRLSLFLMILGGSLFYGGITNLVVRLAPRRAHSSPQAQPA
jgi:hypothetical protein